MVSPHGLPAEQEQALIRDLATQPLLRLGGEGRMAEVEVVERPTSVGQGTPQKRLNCWP